MLQVQYLPLTDVEIREFNPKKHDLEGIKDSIRTYGFKDIIAIFEDKVIFGAGRLEGLKDLERTDPEDVPENIQTDEEGRWLAPFLELQFESEKEAREYLLDHNNLTLLGGDFDAKDVMKLYDEEAFAKFSEGWDLDTLTIDPPEVEFDAGAGTAEEIPDTLQYGDDELEARHVRMVQLFLTTETEPDFRRIEEELRPIFGGVSLSDTVLRAFMFLGDNKDKKWMPKPPKPEETPSE